MSMFITPSQEPGRGSLPAEFRVAYARGGDAPWGYGTRNFGRDRLMAGQRTVRRRREQPGLLGCGAGMGLWNATTGQYDPDETPFDVTWSGNTGNGIDWGSIINNTTGSIVDIIAISQGGSVTPGGVYGSPGVAGQAAIGGGFGGGGINVGAGGLNASGGGLAIVAIGAIAVLMLMSGGRR